jgi:3-hydroxybutyryl-CoA dehydratase
VTATVTILEIDLKTHRVKLSTVCKVRKKTVIDGEAEVYIP